ncbi:MAG: NADH-quinone oxidoreductase subunit N [Planctomycetaceae bacterium]
MISSDTLSALLPEIVLVAAAVAIFLAGPFAGWRAGWTLAVVAIAMALSLSASGKGHVDPVVVIDPFASWVRLAVLSIGGLVALALAGDVRPPSVKRLGTCEEAATFLVLLAGLSLVGAAQDIALLFIGLELVSVPTYVLLGLARTAPRGQEASMKYFFLSLLASAFFLYSLVCLYGIGGSTALSTIGERLRDDGAAPLAAAMLPVAIGMGLAGAAFRMAAVPMHFYAPDVYEGTSTPMAGLLSTLPKLAGIVVLIRLVSLATGPGTSGGVAYAWEGLFWQMTAILAALTMTVGNVMALMQSNLRRLLACSSIAHAGYLLVGVAAAAAADASGNGEPSSRGNWAVLDGAAASLFYLATYMLATAGVFAGITYLGHRWPLWTAANPRPAREEVANVSDLDGLAATNPVVAFALALFLLSLAGIPPLPGFWGKLSLVFSSLEIDWSGAGGLGSKRAWFISLTVVLVANAAIAAAYYLRIISAMYFRPNDRGVQADGGLSAGLAMLAALAAVIGLTVAPGRLFESSSQAGAAAVAPSVEPPATTAGADLAGSGS